MKNMRMFMMLVLISFICLSVYGCGSKVPQDKKIVAKINNYVLTAEDFKGAAKDMMSDKYLSETPEKAKERLLEEIIIKNILVQEAQAQNFDKDRAFMREIEGYWEQALLKLLIKKKIEEFSSKVTVSGGEAKDAKVRQMLENWIKELRKRANVKIYKENLQTIQAR
jgi:hypothetical protein